MTQIPLTRCQFVMPFAEIHSAIGAPTASLLAKFNLPTCLEDKANHYVPLLPAIQFAIAAQDQQGLSELAFQASQRLTLDHLSEAARVRIRNSPTLLVALQQMCKWSSIEDTNLKLWLEADGAKFRICSKLLGTEGIPRLEISQWLQNIFVVHAVRTFAGRGWSPSVMAFEASYVPSIDVQSVWPNTRFISSQAASWIEIPVEFLSLANPASEPLQPIPKEEHPKSIGQDVISVLKLSLPAYLDEGGLSIMQAAEMVGLSVRSLQRTLAFAGKTYSGLLGDVRFHNARRLLRDTEDKIIDIALSSGYADPAHFTRAFRRISGCTPREFRDRLRSE